MDLVGFPASFYMAVASKNVFFEYSKMAEFGLLPKWHGLAVSTPGAQSTLPGHRASAGWSVPDPHRRTS